MISYILHHVNGLYFQITDDEGKDREYDVSVVDKANNQSIFECKLKVNMYTRLERRYLSDLAVIVRYDGRTIKQINLLDEIRGKRVFISFESKAIGDTLAWIPYCREFAKHYDCKVVVSTFKNFLFEKSYPDLEFVGRGITVSNLAAMFELGWYWDKHKEPVNPILIPLQKSATNILNLPFSEVVADVDFEPKDRPMDEKYVCLSMYSTSGLKLWDYWQEVIDFLQLRGYRVVEISKEDEMMGVCTADFNHLERLEDTSLENTMNYIYHSDFFMGLSSGMSWLSWALRKRVYMISNFTHADHEFSNNTIRITDESVCHGCWHDPKFKFNKANWLWCPKHEDTPRHFECHKSIKGERLIEEIKKNENL